MVLLFHIIYTGFLYIRYKFAIQTNNNRHFVPSLQHTEWSMCGNYSGMPSIAMYVSTFVNTSENQLATEALSRSGSKYHRIQISPDPNITGSKYQNFTTGRTFYCAGCQAGPGSC